MTFFDSISEIMQTSKFPCWKLYYFHNHEKVNFGSHFPTEQTEETVNQSIGILERRLKLNPDADFGIYIQEKPSSNGEKIIGLLRFRYQEKQATQNQNANFAGLGSLGGFDLQGFLGGLQTNLENQNARILESEKFKNENVINTLKQEFSIILDKKDLDRQKEDLQKRITEFELKQKEIEAPAHRMGKILESALSGVAEKYLPMMGGGGAGLAGTDEPATEQEVIIERIAAKIYAELKDTKQLLQLEKSLNVMFEKMKKTQQT